MTTPISHPEALAALARVREFITDVRDGKRSIFKSTDILIDLSRIETSTTTHHQSLTTSLEEALDAADTGTYTDDWDRIASQGRSNIAAAKGAR